MTHCHSTYPMKPVIGITLKHDQQAHPPPRRLRQVGSGAVGTSIMPPLPGIGVGQPLCAHTKMNEKDGRLPVHQVDVDDRHHGPHDEEVPRFLRVLVLVQEPSHGAPQDREQHGRNVPQVTHVLLHMRRSIIGRRRSPILGRLRRPVLGGRRWRRHLLPSTLLGPTDSTECGIRRNLGAAVLTVLHLIRHLSSRDTLISQIINYDSTRTSIYPPAQQ